jgi:hypothetical protein
MEDTKEPDFIPQEKASTTADNSQVCDDDKRDRIESDSIKFLYPKCPGGCKKSLTKDVCKRSRNCNLCGNLFCYDCTIYRRKLSQVIKFSTKKLEKSRIQFDIKLIPDDVLGTLHSVCCKCYESETEIPIGRDLMGDFAHFRRGKFEAEDTKAKEGSLCCRKYAYSTFKRRVVIKEVERLTQGFVESSSGFISELVSEVKIPKWQKFSNWVESGGVHHCYHCEKPFKKVLSTKVNCRIGGQVFCTECSKDEMILYLEEKGGEPKWGINGKVGPQSKDLARFELCKICSICSDTLHTIFCKNTALESELLKSSCFMDSIFQLQRSMATLQDKVDKWLPDYIQALEALDGGNVGKMNRDDKLKLAKLHFDVTHAQSLAEKMCHGFQKLQPQTLLPKKMLKNAQMGVQKNYEEHNYQMMYTRDLLSGEMIDELHEVQKLASRRSMERVSADVYQMAADVVEHRDRYNLDDIIPDEADNILLLIDEEFLKGYPWKENYESMMKIRRKSFQIESGSQTAAVTPENVQRMIAGHCSRVARNCYLQLETNTLEKEYRGTKNSLKNAWIKFESML